MIDLRRYRTYLIKKILFISLLAAVVLLLLELFSRYIAATSIASFGARIVVDQKIMMAEANQGTPVIALGDSMIARNFYPELFTQRMKALNHQNYSVVNLGISGGNFYDELAVIDKTFKKNAQPKIAIVNVAVHMLNKTPNPVPEKPIFSIWDHTFSNYYTNCLIEKHQALQAKLYCTLANKLYFFRLLPFYRTQFSEINKTILHTKKTRYNNLITNYPAISSLGFTPVFSVHDKEVMQSDSLHKAMLTIYRQDYQNYTLSVENMNVLIDALKQRSIKVILVLMPLYQPLMRQVHDELGVPSNAFIDQQITNYAHQKNIAFINLFEDVQDVENFADPVHLNIIGASKVTRLLAEKISHLGQEYTTP